VPHPDPILRRIWAVERARRAETVQEVAYLVREYRLPREAVPSQWLGEGVIWEALLETDMPTTALLRNLATLTRVGLLAPGSPTSARIDCIGVVARLGCLR
jgi:60 kDa SS-A/Ro ribonucleoprotein